jgi:hypothetical protein
MSEKQANNFLISAPLFRGGEGGRKSGLGKSAEIIEIIRFFIIFFLSYTVISSVSADSDWLE